MTSINLLICSRQWSWATPSAQNPNTLLLSTMWCSRKGKLILRLTTFASFFLRIYSQYWFYLLSSKDKLNTWPSWFGHSSYMGIHSHRLHGPTCTACHSCFRSCKYILVYYFIKSRVRELCWIGRHIFNYFAVNMTALHGHKLTYLHILTRPPKTTADIPTLLCLILTFCFTYDLTSP